MTRRIPYLGTLAALAGICLGLACSKTSESDSSVQPRANRLFEVASGAAHEAESSRPAPSPEPAVAKSSSVKLDARSSVPPASNPKKSSPARKVLSQADSIGQKPPADGIQRWQVFRPEEAAANEGKSVYISGVSFTADGRTAVAVTSGGNSETVTPVVAWDIATGEEIARLEGRGRLGFSMGPLSPDGRHVPVVGPDRYVRLLDLSSGDEVRRLEGEIGYPMTGSFSPDGRFFLGAGHRAGKTSLHVWDVSTGERVQQFSNPRIWVDTLAFSPDGREALFGGERIWRWNYVTGKVVEESRALRNQIAVAFTADGRHALGRTGTFWHVGSGRSLGGISTTRLIMAEFLPSDQRVLGVDQKGTCRLWEARSGNELMQLGDSQARTTSIAVSPDGRHALTGSLDGIVRLRAIDDAAIAAYEPGQPVVERPTAPQPTYESMPPGRARDEAELTFHLESGRAIRRFPNDAKSAAHLEKAFALAERLHSPEYVDQLREVRFLASYYENAGEFEKAEAWYKRVIEGSIREHGRNTPAVANALRYLVRLYQATDRFDEAERLALQRVEICKSLTEPGFKNHLPMAWSDLFHLYKSARNFEKAEQALLRSTEAWREAYGEADSHVASNLGELLRLYQDELRDDAKAAALYKRVLELQTAQWGPNHPLIERRVLDAATFYHQLGDFDEAYNLLDRVMRIRFENTAHLLASLSEDEQHKALQSAEYNVNFALWLALEKRDDPAIALQSAEWVANLKGLATRALSERSRMALRSANPEVAELAGELKAVRDRLANLSLVGPQQNDVDGYLREQESLQAQQRKLSSQLALAGWEEMSKQAWVPLTEIRAALPGDCVLIDCIRLRLRFDYKRRLPSFPWTEERYAAWIIPPEGKGEVQLLDLGPADRIDAVVVGFHQTLEISKLFIRQQGERRSEAMLREHIRPVSRLIVNRLERHLSDVRHWIISPDSALALIPWGALPIHGRQYAVEAHTISYLVSGRDLTVRQGSPALEPAVIVADPDYDVGLSASRPAPTPFVPLPGTAEEASRIAPLLSRWTNRAPKVLERAAATEQAVKSLSRPRVLVLSTHGFFSPLASLFQNPLLCCGLAFAGANKIAGQTEAIDEDGILTGLEVVGLDLRGTELVVLSACQTGLGKTQPGEGVVGLRQAFALAGADALVSTLWSIPDLETADLTAAFFSHLAEGKGKAEALRAAKLDVIQSRREQMGAAHPVFWAAFTLTGDWD